MLFVLFSEYMEKLEQRMEQLLSQVLHLSRGRKERGGEIEPLTVWIFCAFEAGCECIDNIASGNRTSDTL